MGDHSDLLMAFDFGPNGFKPLRLPHSIELAPAVRICPDLSLALETFWRRILGMGPITGPDLVRPRIFTEAVCPRILQKPLFQARRIERFRNPHHDETSA